MNITNNFSAEAQKALDVFWRAVRYSPAEERAILYQNLALIYHNVKANLADNAAQVISALPIEERFEVLKAVDLEVEEYEKASKEITEMHKADAARKFQRLLEDTIFADKAGEISRIISKLNVDDWSDLCDMIYDALKEKKSAT